MAPAGGVDGVHSGTGVRLAGASRCGHRLQRPAEHRAGLAANGGKHGAVLYHGWRVILAAQFTNHGQAQWTLFLQRIIMTLGLSLVVVGGVTLSAHLVSFPFSFADALGSSSTVVARMSPVTALNFFIVGCAALLHGARWILPFQLLCITTMWFGWLGVCRYIYGGEPIPLLTAMSLNTSLGFSALGVGLLCTRTSGGLMELLGATTQGGVMIRRLLPYTVVIPLAVGWLRLLGQQAGWYGTEAGLSLFVMSNVVIFGSLVWAYARRLHLADLERGRHQAQAAHLSAVVECSDDAIVSKTLGGIITSWNAGAQRLYGYSVDEAIGMPMQDLMLPAERSHEQDILRAIAAGQIVEHREAVRLRKDGSTVDVSLSASPIRDVTGAIIGVSNIARNISDRKRADERLRAQLARLDLLRQVTRAISEHQDLPSIYQVVVRCLEEQMPIDFACVCLYDRNTHTLTVSRVGVNSAPLAMKLALTEQAAFSVDRNGLSRCVRGELVYEPNLNEIDAPFPRRLVGGGLHSLLAAPLQVETMVVGVVLAARRQPNAFSSGECEFLHQLSAHVALATRHAELYSALQRAYDDLRQTQQAVMQHERLRAVGQMASGIAHDINNALTPVVMYTERLLTKESSLSERARNELSIIMRAGEDIAATVRGLREFYRPQGHTGKMAGTDLNQVIQQVIDLTQTQWRDMAHQRGVDIEVRSDLASDLPYVVAVESELREAFTNLVLNAIDAMPTGGVLTLRSRCNEATGRTDGVLGRRTIQVEVSDTGIGMDEQTRQRCLEPFFTTKGERGTGLGLAMVFGIIQRHGGDIAIESIPGQGTTFRLSFSNITTGRNPSVQELSSFPKRLHLLLVDDDPIILKALSDMLHDDGHELVMANGGQEGIDAFLASVASRKPLDVVITDLGMPRVDGRRVAAAVKAAAPTTPVIMLTGWGQRLQDEEQLPPNVDRLLSKPPKIHEIRTVLLHLTSQR
jgi:PAS domain S-box-containing protein